MAVRDFLKERNNSAYCRLKKITCGFKEQARARHPGEKCGLVIPSLPANRLFQARLPGGNQRLCHAHNLELRGRGAES